MICKGRKGVGFWICFNCGSAFSSRPRTKHRSPFGVECASPVRGPLHLGHAFKTDILSISFTEYDFTASRMGQELGLGLGVNPEAGHNGLGRLGRSGRVRV